MGHSGVHSVVVGGGIGGMSMALLLAAAGRRVTLLEACPKIGGFMQRFRRGGVPFDTGFHFTGGFENVLAQMLQVLGIDDMVKEAPFRSRIFFGESGRRLELPGGGVDALADYLALEFPEKRDAVYGYYKCEKAVVEHTPMFDLRDRDLAEKLMLNEYDLMTLDEFFDRLGVAGELRAALGSAAMCHGTPPCESSVTNHCRVSFGLGNHIARVERGGDAFIDGFRREAEKLGIEVRTGVRIAKCPEVAGRRECRRAVLSDGSELEFDDAFLAIHPKAILELLPPEAVNAFFRRRGGEMEDSCGFFTVSGVIDPAAEAVPELTSYLSTPDLNRILLPGGGGTGTGMVIAEERDAAGKPVRTFTAFGSVWPEATARWSEKRDAAYFEYKERYAQKIYDEVYRVYPGLRGRIDWRATSSLLTCRDYAPPTGCAYGVRQKLGCSRIFGRLPVRNFYAIGQSALIPGMLGTMMASFLMFRQVAGEAAYWKLIEARLR